MIYLIAAIFVVAIVIIVIKKRHAAVPVDEPPEKRAGRQGEKIATEIIKQYLNEEDRLLTNIVVTYKGHMTELDNVVINPRGVYIIEVKNLSGELVGKENDKEWLKVKTTAAGNTYEKTVKNPIAQVKRQIYILANFLEACGINVWIEGYILFVRGKSPVTSTFVLDDASEIDDVIHPEKETVLKKSVMNKIIRLLNNH
ncbi:MAG: NERD domain-containing protein [Clostridia bacterium]|nr:NERD domain-containing protein [Clostridia bacterium]